MIRFPRNGLARLGCVLAGIWGLAAHADVPAAPDYDSPASWAAYPGREGAAAQLPAGVEAATNDAVAVFFVHPTTYLATRVDNAPFDADGPTRQRLDQTVLAYQASLFNFSPRLYVPRYRQASLVAITRNEPAAYAADELAYQDVERAFDAFLRAEPNRPFIIASHSQGSIHALRLLQQRVVGTPLQQRLVAAYLAGVALPQEIEQHGLPLCRAATQVGCAMAWNSVRSGHDDERRLQSSVIWFEGRYQPIAGRPLVCFNPLDAELDGAAPASANLGSLPGSGAGQPLAMPIAGEIGAQCENGLLGVDIPPRLRRKFGDVLTLTGIYHDFDYGLYYVNIRQDALRRVQSWRKTH